MRSSLSSEKYIGKSLLSFASGRKLAHVLNLGTLKLCMKKTLASWLGHLPTSQLARVRCAITNYNFFQTPAKHAPSLWSGRQILDLGWFETCTGLEKKVARLLTKCSDQFQSCLTLQNLQVFLQFYEIQHKSWNSLHCTWIVNIFTLKYVWS